MPTRCPYRSQAILGLLVMLCAVLPLAVSAGSADAQARGRIRVIVDTVPDDGTDFVIEREISGGTFLPVTLDDDNDPTLPNSDMALNYPPGTTWRFRQVANPAYSTTVTCVDPTNDTTTAGLVATVTFAPGGEFVECTFTNTRIAPTITNDFGDAPMSYGAPNNAVGPGIRLGACVDAEAAAAPGMAADGDDNAASTNTQGTCATANDDEDGVASIAALSTSATTYSLSVVAQSTGEAILRCWVDFNRNGTFEANEANTTEILVNAAGTFTANFTGFPAPVAGASYARCRIQDGASPTATGTSANIGEVEDYPLTISAPATGTVVIIKDTVPNDGTDFAFTTTGAGLNGFSLDDDADATLSNTQTFINVPVGAGLTVTETANPAYTTTVTCADATANTTVAGATATIDLAADETVTCTFTNARLAAPTFSVSGLVQKDTNNDGTPDTPDPMVPVQLLDSTGKVVASTVSAAGGEYSFPNVPNGSYTVAAGGKAVPVVVAGAVRANVNFVTAAQAQVVSVVAAPAIPSFDLATTVTLVSIEQGSRIVLADVKVSNIGRDSAPESVTTTIQLPPGVSLISTNPSLGSCVSTGTTVTCTNSGLAPGVTVTNALKLQLADTFTTGVLSATAASSASESNTANNTHSVTLILGAVVQPAPLAALALTGSSTLEVVRLGLLLVGAGMGVTLGQRRRLKPDC